MRNFIDLSNDSTSSSSDAENETANFYPGKTSSRFQPSENAVNLSRNEVVKILNRTVDIERKQVHTIISKQNPPSTESYKETLRKQVQILKLKIVSLKKEISKQQSNEEYKQAIRLSKMQKLKIQRLNKINQEWEANYRKLEKKYVELTKEKTLLNLVQLGNASHREEKQYEDIFNIDFKADSDEPCSEIIIEKENDMDVDEAINYEVELSEKDIEIRKQKECLKALEERFKNKDKSERAVKRKLKNMESEKELAAKRLKMLEEEKEKLVDELECTTLCGFCEENPKDTVFDPCGHIWACEKCVSFAKLTKCPSCRKEITNVRKVFIA